ncbi:uncharacterized protein [Aegilops tauschii subsp. strangulata]|uniref:uncharacterized protein n=1 Tax=Aegilops tauschii subsp. strangulata TaxID=200361 RepID=UPI003CC86F40
MHRFLRRTRSGGDLDSPANPFAPIPLAAAPPPAPLATPVPPAAPRAARLAPDVLRGKQAVPEAAPPPPTPAAAPPAATTAAALRTAGSVPVQPLAPGGSGSALALRPDVPDVDSSTAATGLPPSINHFFQHRLELESGNYSKWRQIFYIVCCKYQVQHHLDVPAEPLLQSAVWRNDDLSIVLWFHGVVADELLDVVASPDSTAFDIWQQLHLLFRDNQAGRAVILGAEFRNLVQGDLSIAEYCRRLKSLATDLGDVGERITDRTLTLQLIRGLNSKFRIMATLIPMQTPFPTFVQARSRLLMEEISANKRARLDGRSEATATALTIGSGSGSSGSSGTSTDRGKGATPPATDRDTGGRGRGRGRGRGHGRGSSSPGGAPSGRGVPAPAPVANAPLHGYFAPYGALLHGPPQPRAGIFPTRAPWAAPNAAGVLGPRPPPPQQAYPAVHAPSSAGPTWEQYHQLYAALQNLSTQQNAGSSQDWILDTGASSHVTGMAASLSQCFSPSLRHSSGILVGNGSRLPVTVVGSTKLSSFSLNDVLVSPTVIQNLISVRRFTIDNSCSIEFDPFGFTVKDLATRKIIMRSNSHGDLYPFFTNSGVQALLTVVGSDVWHRRLGHPSDKTISTLARFFLPTSHTL